VVVINRQLSPEAIVADGFVITSAYGAYATLECQHLIVLLLRHSILLLEMPAFPDFSFCLDITDLPGSVNFVCSRTILLEPCSIVRKDGFSVLGVPRFTTCIDARFILYSPRLGRGTHTIFVPLKP